MLFRKNGVFPNQLYVAQPHLSYRAAKIVTGAQKFTSQGNLFREHLGRIPLRKLSLVFDTISRKYTQANNIIDNRNVSHPI